MSLHEQDAQETVLYVLYLLAFMYPGHLTLVDGVMLHRDRQRISMFGFGLVVNNHSVCSELADLAGVIDCYRTLVKSHLSVAVM